MKGLVPVSGVFAGAALLALMSPAMAQDSAQGEAIAPPTPRASAYLETAMLPDWNEVWYIDWGRLFGGRAEPMKLTPKAQAEFDAYTEKYKDTGPPLYAQAQCLPPGLLGVLQQPYPIEILYSPGRVTIITEAYEQIIRIYTDGRKLPEDPDLFFNGNVVGHWEGDVLVFEAIGFHLATSLAPGINHSEHLRIDGRIERERPDSLTITMVLTDPEVLAEPHTVKLYYSPDTFPMREWVCSENNRLRASEEGANVDLGLDEEGEDPFGPVPEGD